MTNYQIGKEIARKSAIEWQLELSKRDISYGELCYQQAYFMWLAKKYGLKKEFKENGII